MSVATLTPLHGLAVGNEVLVEWVASAAPTRTSRSAGRVVGLSTEVVHLALRSGAHKAINLERITGVTVHGLGAMAITKRIAGADMLVAAADALRRGEVVGAQEMLARAMHFAPELGEDW